MEVSLVDTKALLVEHLGRLAVDIQSEPLLYFDLEGNDLSRNGTLSLVTIMSDAGRNKIELIDVTVLGSDAFSTAGSSGDTLKSILESPQIAKVFFDIRNDSDALFSPYGIHVHGIEDLQLFEFASRNFEKRVVHGLAKCMEKDLPLPYLEKQQWQRVKNEGRKLFAPESGGSYAVFDQRPMTTAMMDYCVQDVVHMPRLREIYLSKLCDAWYVKIKAATDARVRLSQGPYYNGKGRHMALGPTGWEAFRPTMLETREKTLFQSSPTKPLHEPSTATTSTSEQSSALATTSISTPSGEPSTIREVQAQTIGDAHRGNRYSGRGHHASWRRCPTTASSVR